MDPQFQPPPPSLQPPAVPLSASGGDPGPFFGRVFLMAFLPRMWSAAARWRPSQVIAPLAILIVCIGAGMGAYRSQGLRPELRRLATAYDASYPAIIVANAEVRVDGDRVIQVVEGRTTYLVDPNETIPTESITTPEYLVVRKHEVIRKDQLRTQTTRVAEIASLWGGRPLRIDSHAMLAFDAKWGSALQLGVVAFLLVFVLVSEGVSCALYSLVGGALVLGIRGRALALDFGACFRVALAVSSLTVVLATALSLLGHGPGVCLGVLIWPTLLTALAAWAVGRD